MSRIDRIVIFFKHAHSWEYRENGVFPEPKLWRSCECGAEQCFLHEIVSGFKGWFDSKQMIKR